MGERQYPKPAKGACVYCPYHDNKFWKEMRDERPKEWKTRSLTTASSWHYFAYEQLDNNEKEYRRYFRVLNDFATLS